MARRLFVYNTKSGDWTEYIGLDAKYPMASPRQIDPKLYFIMQRNGEELLSSSDRNDPPYDGDIGYPVGFSRITKYTDFGLPDHDKRIRKLRVKALCFGLDYDLNTSEKKYILGTAKSEFPLNIRIYSDYQDTELDANYWEYQFQISSDKITYEVSVPNTVVGRVFKIVIWEDEIIGVNEYMTIQEVGIQYRFNEEKYAP